jgi:hypothetical protein
MERRSVPRYFLDRLPLIRVLVRPSFRRYSARVHNISTKGLGLVCDRFLEPGSVLAIQLQRRHAGVSGILSAKVVSSAAQCDGTWLCGCRLSRSLTDDEIFALL